MSTLVQQIEQMRSRMEEIAKSDGRLVAALADAAAQGITGKQVTPFLLARIRDITGGASQRANVALALNNARLGARIAVAFAALPMSAAMEAHLGRRQ